MGPLKCGLIESGLNIQGPKYTKLKLNYVALNWLGTKLCGLGLAWNQIMWPWIGLEPNYVALHWLGTKLCGQGGLRRNNGKGL